MEPQIRSSSAIGSPITIDPELCTGCNDCVEVCRTHIILPNAEAGEPPQIWYPDECWYCGCCVSLCLTGAVRMRYPVSRRVGWKRKGSDEFFRIGMEDPPRPNDRPPVCPDARMR